MYHIWDMLVPVGIFLAGILVSWSAGGFGVQRLVEAQTAAKEALARTAAYESPLRSEQDSIHGADA